jgi:CrcB protein
MVTTPALQALAVGLGGAAGATCRHLVGLALDGRRSLAVVNTLGSFALGAVLAAPVGAATTLAAGVGFCGAFTTFSSVAVETVVTAENGERGIAAGFAVGLLLAAVAAAVAGAAVGLAVT